MRPFAVCCGRIFCLPFKTCVIPENTNIIFLEF